MLFNKDHIREEHSLMEAQRSSSYAIFADAKEYWFSYDSYLALIKKYAEQQPTVNILNIGAATGILEYLALQNISNIHFVSIDNSESFKKMFFEKNKNFIKQRKIEYVFSNIQDYNPDLLFDIIVSRDINHHLELEDVRDYISNCYSWLNHYGSFIIEDLKREAERDGILDLLKVVYDIPSFADDTFNRYHKIMGIIDSYFVAYSTEEIYSLIKNMSIPFELENEKYRYKFILKKLCPMM